MKKAKKAKIPKTLIDVVETVKKLDDINAGMYLKEVMPKFLPPTIAQQPEQETPPKDLKDVIKEIEGIKADVDEYLSKVGYPEKQPEVDWDLDGLQKDVEKYCFGNSKPKPPEIMSIIKHHLQMNKENKMKEAEIINKYIERIKVDYPEDDKLYLDLKQFATDFATTQQPEVSDVEIENLKMLVYSINPELLTPYQRKLAQTEFERLTQQPEVDIDSSKIKGFLKIHKKKFDQYCEDLDLLEHHLKKKGVSDE